MAKKERKIIVTAAVTGAIHTPSMSPYLPCGVQGISQAAIDAANAGASMVHIHAREDNGKPTSDLDTMGQILSRIKENSDVIIGITTGGAIGMSVAVVAVCALGTVVGLLIAREMRRAGAMKK